jgi:hypothetical protein
LTNINRIYQVKEDETNRACSMNLEKRNAFRVLVGKPKRERTPGRLRSMWEDNIIMVLREIGWSGTD